MVTTYQRPLVRTCIDCGATLSPDRYGFYCQTHGRESPPRIPVTVTRGRDGWILEFACRWCQPRRGKPRIHSHGGGKLDEEPMLGDRVSHCRAPGAPGGYELVAAPSVNTENVDYLAGG